MIKVACLFGLALTACNTSSGSTGSHLECLALPKKVIAEPVTAGLDHMRPSHSISESFLQHWADGKAELSGYRIKTERYGVLRKGTLVLIYVKEPMSRRTWIKDDDAEGPDRVDVLKLNAMLDFRTGIYPYSVMTSVFTPLSSEGREPFSPSKISLTAQEWCGHVYHAIYPKGDRFHTMLHSYFASEGDTARTTFTGGDALYEDALLIQLRELDGPFAGGKRWSGKLVPSLWSNRRRHEPLAARDATITRSEATRGRARVTRFVVKTGRRTTTLDIEKRYPHRILGWTADGEEAVLLGTARLPYWELNRPGGESYLRQLGL
jgi:hypothetical protein